MSKVLTEGGVISRLSKSFFVREENLFRENLYKRFLLSNQIEEYILL